VGVLYDARIAPLRGGAREEAGGSVRSDAFLLPLVLAFLLACADLALARARAPRLAIGALIALSLASCDATEPGREAYARGDVPEALASFDRAIAEAGEDASAALHYDRALAAWRLGLWDEADASARTASERGDATVAAHAAFLRGNVAYARSRAQAEQARAVTDGDGREWLAATQSAEDAVAAWQTAAASRRDWPAARRNVERGLLWLEALRERSGRRSAREGERERGDETPDAGRAPPAEPPPSAPPPEPPRPEPPGGEGPPVASAPLPEARVPDLLRRLEVRERQKSDLRRRSHAASPTGSEW
jgi:hypothetical protein